MTEVGDYDMLDQQHEAREAVGNGSGAYSRSGEGRGSRSSRRDDERRDSRRDDRRDPDGDRGGDRSRDRERDRRSRRRSRSRSRNRDKDKKYRSRSRDRHRSSHCRRSYSKERNSKRREYTPPEVRQEREREKEMKELERDSRTVFAFNLSLKADERDVFDFFSHAGQIVDVRIITDKNTRRSKGFAYIEFENQEDILPALALTGQPLLGQPVMVKPSEAHKNLAWEAQQQAQKNQQAAANLLSSTLTPPAGAPDPGAGAVPMQPLTALPPPPPIVSQPLAVPAAPVLPSGPCRLYVGNLHPECQEVELRTLFQEHGNVESVSLHDGVGGAPSKFGYVQYSSVHEATKAMAALNGMEHREGHAITVTIASINPMDTSNAAGPAPTLDEDEMGGMKLSSQARASLINRLASSHGIPQATNPLLAPGAAGMAMGQPAAAAQPQPATPQIHPDVDMLQGALGPRSPIATECLLLKNLFDPETETEEDWDKEIAEEVKTECSKHGAVTHIHVDANSKVTINKVGSIFCRPPACRSRRACRGFVYLRFASKEACQAAQRQLHGRIFAGRQVAADFQFTKLYNDHFQL